MIGYDAIVIGGGINGIAAASLLSNKSKSVVIIEQRSELGGMAAHRREGPPAAHLLWNLNPKVIKDLGLGSIGFDELTSVDTICFCESGKHIRVKNNGAFYLDGEMVNASGSFRELTNRLSKYGILLKQVAENTPFGVNDKLSSTRDVLRLLRFGLSLKLLGKSQMRKFLQDILMNVSDFILDDLPDGPLAGLLSADATRGQFSGPRNPGTVFNLVYRYGHGCELTRPTKGMRKFFELLENAIKNLNVDIKTRVKAKKILIEEDSVKGVELADGTTLFSNMVLCSSGLNSMQKMTGISCLDIEDSRSIKNLRTMGTTAKVNLKLSELPIFENIKGPVTDFRFVVAPSIDYVDKAFNSCKYGEFSQAPVSESVFTIRQSEFWLSSIIQFIPSKLKGGWNEASKEHLKQVLVQSLTEFIPDLCELIEDYEVITPNDFAQDLDVEGGNWHHSEMSLDQIFNLRPTPGFSAYRAGPKGLYLCGSSSHPGGDIMGLSGRNAAITALRNTK